MPAKAKLHYDWTRFWVPHNGTVDLSDFGFLRDPTDRNLGLAPSALALPDLASIPALVLLGEMGIGKSTTLKTEADRIAVAGDPNLVSVYVDLRAYGSEAVLLQKIFGSPAYVAWKAGTGRLVLHLDSLDEALLRVETVANLLAAELPGEPTDRLSIRIACRTAVWPSNTLGIALGQIWDATAVGVFELAPLRRKDVRAAVDASGIEAEAFFQALFTANAVPFAIKPLTLNMLLALYKRDGRLPDSTTALYTQGCLKLCEEQNPSRIDTRRRGRLAIAQRLRLAGRIAAATMLANRYAVWTGPEADGVPPEFIPVSALTGGHEEGDFTTFEVTTDDILEVLDTGLFNARGDNLMGWAHQGYAEFLAAKYLADKNIDPATILKILRHPEGGLVPQLATVAAWAASLDAEVRAPLLVAEPMALLSADLTNWQDEERAALTKSLLDAYSQRRLNDTVVALIFLYAKLKQPGLAAILRPFLTDKTIHYVARRAAFMIARACATTELQPELLQVAFDASEDESLRARAVVALETCGDATVPPQLLPLARGEVGDDPTCDIRGAALDILWPQHLSGAQLFGLLTPPNEGYFGTYTRFLHELAASLKPEHLLPALEWSTGVIRCLAHTHHAFTLKRLADGVLFRAWDAMEQPGIMPALLENIAARLFQHGSLCRGTDYEPIKAFQATLANDSNKRRRFLRALAATDMPAITAFSYVRSGLMTRGDFAWLLSLAPGGVASDPALSPETILNLVGQVMDWSSIEHGEAFYTAAMHWPLLYTRYAGAFDGVPLDSPEVARHREMQEQMRKLQDDAPPPLEPAPDQRVLARLEKFEGGDLSAWWVLNMDLTLTPTSRAPGWDLEYHITKMHGWESADADLRRRLLAAAERYLMLAPCTANVWIGTNQIQRPDFAAWRAFILLHDEAPSVYEALPQEIWERWTPAIVGVPKNVGSEHPQSEVDVYRHAYEKAPAAFVATVRAILAVERAAPIQSGTPVSAGFAFHILRELPEIADFSLLFAGMFEELQAANNTPEQFTAILEFLLEHNHAPARAFAEAIVVSPATNPLKPIAAQKLLNHCAAAVWPALWPYITSGDAAARQLFLDVARHYHFENPFYVGLNETALAQLYILLVRLFPRAGDPQHRSGRAHAVGPLDSIARLRDTLPPYLVGLGTRGAVAALRQCIAALPDHDWLSFELARAEQVMRVKTWAPLDLKELFTLCDRAGSTLISSPEELRDLVVAALRDFEHYLHGEQTPIKGLWDWQAASKTWRPKDENAFSDMVKLYLERSLRERGIIANREVEISHAPGAPVGQRTDIRIDAVRRRADGTAYDVITVIVESKGCWNPDLFSAQTNQLYGDYMTRLLAPIGIYLVAWFDTEKWDPDDHRRRKIIRRSRDRAQAQLSAEAAGLSKGVSVIAIVLRCQAP